MILQMYRFIRYNKMIQFSKRSIQWIFSLIKEETKCKIISRTHMVRRCVKLGAKENDNGKVTSDSAQNNK